MLEEADFYSALEKRHGKEIQEVIRQTEVTICGLGGLGSNIAIALSRCGIGKLRLIDFDCVDISNCNRQQYFLSQVLILNTFIIFKNILKGQNYYLSLILIVIVKN